MQIIPYFGRIEAITMSLQRTILLTFCLFSIQIIGQDILFYENFENGNSSFNLNTLSEGSTDSGSNHWVVNNSYEGGSGTLECLGFPFDFEVINTTQQPSSITNSPTSNYLHISSLAAEAIGITNASFIAADGFCNFEESYFAEMNFDIDASDYSDIKIAFEFMNASSLQFEAKVFYSTNSGLSWIQAGQDINPNTNDWSSWEHQDVFFSNQASLRLGFQFKNVAQLGAEDPPLSIDEIQVTGIKECEENGIQLQTFLCEGDSLLIGGEYITETGTYIDTLQNIDGCDSVITNSLIFNPSYINPLDTIVLCSGDSVVIGGVPIFDPGFFVENNQTAFGCDSVSLFLVLLEDNEVILEQEGTSIFVSESFESYQWFNCATGSILEGETSSTLEPQESGEYGVIVSSANCEYTSECIDFTISGLREIDWNVSVYPNPFLNNVLIESERNIDSIILYNSMGQIILSENYFTNNISLDFENLSQGTYILELRAEKSLLKKRIIKI